MDPGQLHFGAVTRRPERATRRGQDRQLIEFSERESGVVPGFHSPNELTCTLRAVGLEEESESPLKTPQALAV